MIKILGRQLWLLLFTSAILHAGSIESIVDSTEIARGDSVLFSIIVVGVESDPLPEMSEIDGIKIDQITRNNGSDFVHVDGKSVMQHTTTVTYEFKPKYNMTIPAFQVKVDGKVETSKAINLKVVKAVAGTKRKNKYFSLDIKLNKERVYVGEPVVATVYFRQNMNIKLMELDYKKPEFSAFFSKQLEDETTYTEGVYTVHELKYLLIAKREGKTNIEPATAKVAQRVQERQEGGWFANVPKWSNIASPSLSLEVLSAPTSYDLGGDFTLSSTIDKEDVKANKPVNVTIELKGEGSLEDFTGIEFDLPNVTVYSDDAKVKSSYKKDKLTSHYVKSFAFIADHDFTIPSKKIRLFNYKTGQIKVLKTNSYSIKVDGGRKTEVEPMSVVHTNKPVEKEQKQESELVTKKDSILQKFKNLPPTILLLSLMFFLGAVSSIFILYMFKYLFGRKKGKQQAFNGHEALQILYPHMGDSPDVEYMVRQLYAIKNGEKKIKIDRELLKELLNKYKPNSKL
jgi:hypothetical protein